MKKFTFLFLAIFFAVDHLFAANQDYQSQEEIICKTSPACKEVCKQGIIDKFDELSVQQKQLVLQCAQDMSKKFNLEPKQSIKK